MPATTIKQRRNSRTGPQINVTIDQFSDILEQKSPTDSTTQSWDTIVENLRTDPTISLVRSLLILPVLSSPWTIEAKEGASEESIAFIKDNVFALRTHIIRQSFFGCIDYGWAPFEKVFTEKDGLFYLGKLKPLLQELTDILVHVRTGAFKGFRNENPISGEAIDLPTRYSFLHSFDVRGTNWYGRPLLKNVEAAYNWWTAVNTANTRYDEKLAGAQWIIKYPMGTSTYNGTETDNSTIAKDLLNSLKASGGVSIPKKVDRVLENLSDTEDPNAWELNLVESKANAQSGFVDRLTYLDKLKVRGFGFPERAVLEGKFGTKAEAESHADLGLALQDARHDELLRDVNWHIVNQLLKLNFGEDAEDTIVITRRPIAEETKKFLREIYRTILANKRGWEHEVGAIDVQSLRELLQIPADPEAGDIDPNDLPEPEGSADSEDVKDEDGDGGRGVGDPSKQNPEGEQS